MTSPQAIQTTVDPAPAPAAIVEECDLATGLRPIPAPRAGIEALVLVRLFTEPIGMLDEPLPAGGLSAHDLSRAIAARFEPELRDRFHESGLEWTGELPSDGLEPPRRPRFLTTRERVMHDGPSLTVAICTHDRADSLSGTGASAAPAVSRAPCSLPPRATSRVPCTHCRRSGSGRTWRSGSLHWSGSAASTVRSGPAR